MNRLRARASTWSTPVSNPDHANANANANAVGGIAVGGIVTFTSSNTPNTSNSSGTNSNRKSGIRPLSHKRNTSNSSQNSKLSISSWDVTSTTNTNTSTTNSTSNMRAFGNNNHPHPLEIKTSLNDDPQDNMDKELQQLQLRLQLQELQDKTPTAGNSKYHQQQLLEQKLLIGSEEFFFPIGIPNPDDKGYGATIAIAGGNEGMDVEKWRRNITDDNVEEYQKAPYKEVKDEDTTATYENAMDVEMGPPPPPPPPVEDETDTDEEDIYPPNLNITTGPLNLNLNAVGTKDSFNSLEYHDAESHPHSQQKPLALRRVYSHDEQEGGDDNDNNNEQNNNSDADNDRQSTKLSVQKSQDTFDTPNSGRSRTSLVRFVNVNDTKTPLSYVRHPPASLILKYELGGGHCHGHENGDGKTHGLLNANRDLCLNMEGYNSNDTLPHPLRPSFHNGHHIYSFNSDDGDTGKSDSGSGSGNGSAFQLLPREMLPLRPKGHDRQASYAASIDSLEFNSMRHMDPETCTSGGGDGGSERSKIALIMGMKDWYASDQSNSHEYDYEPSHEGDHEVDHQHDQNNSKPHSHLSNSRSSEHKLGICERLCNACWCWPNTRKPSWSRVSSAVVRHAPCFWCCVKRSQTGGTDRVTLTRLNVLCAVFALWQFGVGIFILVVFLSTSVVDRNLDAGTKYTTYYKEALTPNLWMMSGSLLILSVVGFVLFITMGLTIPVIRRVNLVGAIRFMWVLYWVLPLQIFFVIALFDYHNVTDVWIKHWWGAPSMAWFRNIFCESGTANEECLAPFKGGSNFTDIETWCNVNYNSTDTCEAIRNSAENKMQSMSYFFFYLNAIIGGILVILLLLSLGLLESIISAPIVQRSKETNIPLWLTFPIIFCFATGTTLMFNSSSLVNSDSGSKSLNWIGVCYILSGATFTVSALLGWFM